MKISFINQSYRRFWKEHKDELTKVFTRCMSQGDFVLRSDVEKFEQNLAKITGNKYCVAVNSGTDALKISYRALGCKQGDEVITVGHTFISSIEEIVHLGAEPVLVDIGEDGLIDVSLIEDAITDRTVGIVPVHLSGKVCNMPEIMKIAKKHKLWVVEDACQAIGQQVYPIMGNTACYSFISPKLCGGYGDNGAIVTNDKKLYERMRLMRNHWNVTQNALLGAQPKQPKVMEWGYNSRMDNIQAALMNVRIKYLPQILKRRAEIAKMYVQGLCGLPLELPEYQEGQVFQEFILRVPQLKKFGDYMKSRGIEVLIRDTIPNHKLKGLGLEHFNLPITERVANKIIRLPIYPELTNEEVDYIIKSIQEFYGWKKNTNNGGRGKCGERTCTTACTKE